MDAEEMKRRTKMFAINVARLAEKFRTTRSTVFMSIRLFVHPVPLVPITEQRNERSQNRIL